MTLDGKLLARARERLAQRRADNEAELEARRAKWPAKDPQLGRMLAMTDARHYAGRGVPVLIAGACGGKAHAADEWNDLANMDENVEMLEAFFAASAKPVR